MHTQGLLQRLACDGPDSPWLLTGTSRGHLTLWDMRFQIPLTQWDHPSGQPVEALAPAVAPVGHLGLRGGGKGSSPLVYIAAGAHEVGLWDIEEGKCHQVRTTMHFTTFALQQYRPSSELVYNNIESFICCSRQGLASLVAQTTQAHFAAWRHNDPLSWHVLHDTVLVFCKCPLSCNVIDSCRCSDVSQRMGQ